MSPETASVVAAAIAAVAAIGVAVVGVVGSRQHRDTRAALADNTTTTQAVLHQVKNDHDTNLRDDLDNVMALAAEHTIELAAILPAVARLSSTLGSLRRDVGDVAKQQQAHDAASLIIVDELHKADRALAQEIAKHHPRVP